MKIEELNELKLKVLNNQITVEDAKQMIFENAKKSWHTKEWKDKRNSSLKDECEKCGSTNILTIQHTWHPKNYGECMKESTIFYYNKYEEENIKIIVVSDSEVIREFDKEDSKTQQVCPVCGYGIRERKTMLPRYICTNPRETHQSDEFEERVIPILIDDRNIRRDYSWKSYERSYLKIWWKIYNSKRNKRMFKKYGDAIEREALVMYIDDSIRYQSFEDVITVCKKCAFNTDVNNIDLCPICMKSYKKTYYDTCLSCKLEKKIEQNGILTYRIDADQEKMKLL